MNIRVIKAIQNQASFTTSPYKEHVTPLPNAVIEAGFPVWMSKVNLESFWSGLLLYLCGSRYDVVVSVALLPSFVYGMMCRLFGKRKTVHVCKEFYLETESKRLAIVKKIRLFLLRFSLKKVDIIILNASAEANYYSNILKLPIEHFRFVAWPTNINTPEFIETNNNYFLAVGRSLRDWVTFFKAVEGTPYKYIVIATAEDASFFPLLDNVVVKVDVNRQEYLEILKKSKAVVLPLKPTIRSTGQATFLEAMAFGKPVIASNVVGVQDYLQHEYNALLCNPENPSELNKCIVMINDDQLLYDKLANQGYQCILNKFNKDQYALNMLSVLKELVATN
jgi:glycosyltransferase involved in cell wall biosynthesis